MSNSTTNSNSNNFIISVEGNIGSGKSSFLTFLKQKYNTNKSVVFLQEPVDDWETIVDENGKSMLQKYYENPQKYSFAFQMMAYISRLSILKKAAQQSNVTIITERSLLTDKFVFAKMLYDEGKIEKVEYDIYEKWFYEFIGDLSVDLVVYIKADPQTCYERVKQRGRKGEDVIPLEYLEKCHQYHEDYIQNMKKGIIYNMSNNSTNKDIQVKEINGNINITTKDHYESWLKKECITMMDEFSQCKENTEKHRLLRIR